MKQQRKVPLTTSPFGFSYFVLEPLQWMDSSVAARHEQTTASRITAPQPRASRAITGVETAGATAARDHERERERSEICCLFMSPVSPAAPGARRERVSEPNPPKLRASPPPLDELLHIARNWPQNHSCDEIIAPET